jgi:tagatose-6-phosphate ketose/aldose isomerase
VLLVFLSSHPTLRACQTCLNWLNLSALKGKVLRRSQDKKGLGLLKVGIGEKIPLELILGHDVAIDCRGLSRLGEEDFFVIGVLAGQLLAFFCCLGEGLRPDSRSEGRAISRVVQTFALNCPEN